MPAVQDGLLAEGGEALPVGGHQRGVSPGGTRGHIAPGKMIGDKVQSKCQVQKLSTEMIAKNVEKKYSQDEQDMCVDELSPTSLKDIATSAVMAIFISHLL